MAIAPAHIRSLAREHTESAIKTLVQIMRQPKAPAPARVSAACYLLNRGWGMPETRITDELAITVRHVISGVERRGDDALVIDADVGRDGGDPTSEPQAIDNAEVMTDNPSAPPKP